MGVRQIMENQFYLQRFWMIKKDYALFCYLRDFKNVENLNLGNSVGEDAGYLKADAK